MHAEERKKKISESMRGNKNPFYGKHHSDETKEKLRIQRKGKRLTEEYKKKISEAITGEKNPFKGKHHSEESKEKNEKSKTWKKAN